MVVRTSFPKRITRTAYNQVNLTLRFRKERQRECRAILDFTLYRDYTALPLDDGLSKGEPQSNPLCVKGMLTAIKAFENMVNIFRVYAGSII